MKKNYHLYDFPNIDGFFKPFRTPNPSSNVSPHNRIVKAYFYGSSHPGFPEQKLVSNKNRLIKSFFFEIPIKDFEGESIGPSVNKFINSRIKITKAD